MLLVWHLKKQLTPLGIQICLTFIMYVLDSFGDPFNPPHEDFLPSTEKINFLKVINTPQASLKKQVAPLIFRIYGNYTTHIG